MNRPPFPSVVLERWSCKEWLICRAVALAESNDPLDQAASVGLIARLWCPTLRPERDRLLAEELPAPSLPILAWIRGLHETEANDLEQLAIRASGTLLTQLDKVRAFDSDEYEERFASGLEVMRRRDVLESVSFLLGMAGTGKALREALRVLDLDAVASYTSFPTPDAFRNDEWLRDVARTEPHAWWGAFADTVQAARDLQSIRSHTTEELHPEHVAALCCREETAHVAYEDCPPSPVPLLDYRRERACHTLIMTVQSWCRETVSEVRLRQGRCGLERRAITHFARRSPPGLGRQLVVWFRNGWDDDDRGIVEHIRCATRSDGCVYVVIPSDSTKERDRLVAGLEEQDGAGQETSLEDFRDRLLRSMRVLLPGAEEIRGESLSASLSIALAKAQDQLYPRFSEADHPGWQRVIVRARAGDETPLEEVEYRGDATKHPVTAAILEHVGAERSGSEVLEDLQRPGYGWPLEAIQGGLYALVAAGELTASNKSGKRLDATTLAPGKIERVMFRSSRDRDLLLHLLKISAGLPGTEEIRRELQGASKEDQLVVAKLIDKLSELIRGAIAAKKSDAE